MKQKPSFFDFLADKLGKQTAEELLEEYRLLQMHQESIKEGGMPRPFEELERKIFGK
ncbi:MAG: hypothetical protein HY052_05630 [Proteobacteria bacterium]|nr:hypothetical protein [Pseudomonadota bacterium]